MKKNVLLVLALLGTLSTYAQVNFGVKAGFSGASVKFKQDGVSNADANEGNKMLPTWHAGLLADIQLAENFYVQPALLYSNKGVKNSSDMTVAGVTVKSENSLNLTYLELPVNLLYKQELGSGKIFGGFGPYVAYGLGGKSKSKVTTGTVETSGDVKIKFDGKKDVDIAEGDTDFHLKGLDAGANFILGYELKNGFLVSANYSLGLSNIDPNDKSSMKNSYFGISLGFILK
jgi:hypothetical protein